jgi:hypothetical protein
MSDDERTDGAACPRCGGPVARGARLGTACPACLMALALEPAPTDDESVDEGNVYRVVTVLEQEPGRTVYLADSRDTGQLVTLDIVKPHPTAPLRGAAFLDRLRRLRGLSHPSLAAVLDGRVTSTGDFCVVARFVAGMAFERACGQPDAKSADIVTGLLAICDALDLAHRAGVPHGRLDDGRRILSCGPLSRPVVTGFGMWQAEPPTPLHDVEAVAALARRLGVLCEGDGAESMDAIRSRLRAPVEAARGVSPASRV